jgi:signal transduction histidine kinase/DNA-binding response OmpR family regulator
VAQNPKPQLRTSRRLFPRQPIRRKLAYAGTAFIAAIVLLLSISWFAMDLLSSVRAYVGGEGLWSKAQKDAVHSLTKYAYTEDERDYQQYLALLRIPLSDRRARLELEKEASDLEVADQAFVEARNHPEDVRGMSLLFKRFRHLSYLDRAIARWTEADALIEDLQAHADELHRTIQAGRSSDGERRALLARIDVVAAKLTVAEDDFSFTLGEAARWLNGLLTSIMLIATALSLTFSGLVAYSVSNGILRDVANLRDGTARIGLGDFRERLSVDSYDELGQLGVAFNQMTDSLVRSTEERREAEDKLALRAAELEVANQRLLEHEKIKSEFFATVSHELRTPLALILAPLESLLEGEYGALPDRSRPSLATMHNNAVRLLQIVQGLLDFQKLEAKKVEVNREPIAVGALTRSILGDFEGMMKTRGVRGHIEAAPESTTVQMDRYLYERILFNLLSNAVKFTPRGGEIFVRLELANDRLLLSVRDTGIGISDDDKALLFRRFQQVEGAATRRFEGVGLGLALVREFAELLDGSATVESRLGEGSTFTVQCSAPERDGHEARTPSPSSPSSAPRHRLEYDGFASGDQERSEGKAASVRVRHPDGRILVVEDNAELAAYIAEQLGKLCETRVAHDGEDALEVVRDWTPTLILSDVMMPRRDGLSLCRELKSRPETRGIPFVLLTALTYREALLRGWEAGADDYLFKPFHPTELMTRMQTLLTTQLSMLEQTRAKVFAEDALKATAALAEERRVRLIEVRATQSAAEKAREQAAFLAGASALLVTSLDYKSTLEMVARFVVSRIADWCAVDVAGAQGETETLRIVHVDPAKQAAAASLPSDSKNMAIVERVFRTGKSERAALDHLGLQALMVVPIVARGRSLGTISFASIDGTHPYGAGALELAEELARRVGLAIDNARLYESEQKARQSADLASRAKDEFLGTVSHELRTPLNAILGWARLLRAGDLSQDEYARAVETIERNAENQAQLIEDLLDVTRIISGKLSLDMQLVQLVPIIEHAIDTLRLAGEAKKIDIFTTFDPDVGPVTGDPHRLQQVVWNLLSNAIKFTPKGGRVDVKLEGVAAGARIVVADTGQGITPEFLPHVFERFQQADGATTRAYGGLGIGLAIARHIVERHGGSIEVHSPGVGRGSTFAVVLEGASGTHSGRGSAPRLASLPGAIDFEIPPELQSLRVLIVDDEEDARDLLAAVLQKCGAITSVASSAADALACIGRDRPDLLISDIGMPGEDGYDLIRQVRALAQSEGGNIPAAALTAYASAEDRKKVLNAGYMMHVPKPVEPAELVAVVASLARFITPRH